MSKEAAFSVFCLENYKAYKVSDGQTDGRIVSPV